MEENHHTVIDLPAHFDAQDAEVIVLPVKMLAEGVENNEEFITRVFHEKYDYTKVF